MRNRFFSRVGTKGAVPKDLNVIQAVVLSFARDHLEFEAPRHIQDEVVPSLAELTSNELDAFVESLSEYLENRHIYSDIIAPAIRVSNSWDDIAREIFDKQTPGRPGGSGGGGSHAPFDKTTTTSKRKNQRRRK